MLFKLRLRSLANPLASLRNISFFNPLIPPSPVYAIGIVSLTPATSRREVCDGPLGQPGLRVEGCSDFRVRKRSVVWLGDRRSFQFHEHPLKRLHDFAQPRRAHLCFALDFLSRPEGGFFVAHSRFRPLSSTCRSRWWSTRSCR